MRNSASGIMKIVVLCSPAVLGGPGCTSGEGPPREAVQGKVSRAGQPLEKGSIQFMNSEASGGAVIANGEFSIAAAPGLPPGKYEVVIEAGDAPAAPAVAADEAPGVHVGPSHKGSVAKRQDEKEKFTADVKAGGPNVFEFSLKK